MRKTLILFTIFLVSCNNSTDLKTTTEKKDSLNVVTNFVADTSGMIFFNGGEITIGNDKGTPFEKSAHTVDVKPFYIDKNLVTVKQFRTFIKATGFASDAENFGDAGVFNSQSNQWELIKGATWKKPFGPDATDAVDDHPVTQVSWRDAEAYARWSSKRLPTEAEWEYAARNGKNDGRLYPWGKEVTPAGKYKANTWQGNLDEKQGKDGFVYTSPVGYYGELESGLTDMAGNVWQWCQDVFSPYPGSTMPYQGNPSVKVIRGGAFTLDQNLEKSFTVSYRASNTLETSLFNTGFRCAKDK